MHKYNERSLFFYNRKYKGGIEREHSYKIKLLDFIPLEKSKVLDVGCGSGTMAEKISFLGHDVEGVDISHEAIERLKNRGLRGKVVNVDEGLPYHGATFDVVWCGELIEHVQSPEILLDEINRVLKKDGILLLTTCNSAYFVFRIMHLFGRTCSEIQHPYHFHFYSSRSLKKLLTDSNFRILELAGRNTPVIFPKKILKPLFFIPFLTEEKVLKFFKLFNFHLEDTVTRGQLVLFSFFSRRLVSFFADAFLIKAYKV